MEIFELLLGVSYAFLIYLIYVKCKAFQGKTTSFHSRYSFTKSMEVLPIIDFFAVFYTGMFPISIGNELAREIKLILGKSESEWFSIDHIIINSEAAVSRWN